MPRNEAAPSSTGQAIPYRLSHDDYAAATATGPPQSGFVQVGKPVKFPRQTNFTDFGVDQGLGRFECGLVPCEDSVDKVAFASVSRTLVSSSSVYHVGA
jgi:hypothetical protein